MATETPPETSATLPDDTPAPQRKPPRLLFTLAALWTAAIVAIWFAFHPLFQVEFPLYPAEVNARIAPAIGGFLLDLLLLGLTSLAAWSVGNLALSLAWRMHRAYLSSGEIFIFSIGLGLGLNILIILALGLFVGATGLLAYLLLAAELLTLLRFRRGLLTAPPATWRVVQSWRQSAPGWEKWLTLWLGGLAALTLLMALAPPLSWDTLMYHLAGVQQYVAAGRIINLPEIGQTYFPFGAEMLFLWGMLLHGEGLAQAFSWLYGLLGVAACVVFAQRFFGQLGAGRARQVGLLAGALYLSSYHVWLLMTWAYTDLMLAFYALLALQAFLRAVEQQARVALALAFLGGLMAGFSCGGKYTGILSAAGAVAAAWLYGWRQKSQFSFGKFMLAVVAYGVGGALSFGPWLLRNFIFAGNPFAPFYGGIRGWWPEEVAFLVAQDGGVALTPDVILGRPFQMILTGRNNGLFDATISPLTLALLPLGIWAAWRSRAVAALWLMAGVTYVGWLSGIRQSAGADHTRIMAAIFPLVALITAYALLAFLDIASWKNSAQLLRLVSRAGVGLCLAASLLAAFIYVVANNPLPYHFGLQSRREWVEAQLGEHYQAARFVNSTLPPDAKLFMACEPRLYYFERATLPDHNMCGQFFTYVAYYPTPEKLQAQFAKEGATYFLINDSLLNFILKTPQNVNFEKAQRAAQVLTDLQSRQIFEKVYQNGLYTIYKIRSSS